MNVVFHVCSLHKVLFTEQPETYYKWDNWPPESDRKSVFLPSQKWFSSDCFEHRDLIKLVFFLVFFSFQFLPPPLLRGASVGRHTDAHSGHRAVT